jgi:hypothetical protein
MVGRVRSQIRGNSSKLAWPQREHSQARGDDDSVGAHTLTVVQLQGEPTVVSRYSVDLPRVNVRSDKLLEPRAIFEEILERHRSPELSSLQALICVESERLVWAANM